MTNAGSFYTFGEQTVTMQYIGVIDKMPTSYINPVQYTLPMGDLRVNCNDLVGQKIQLRWTGNIYCTICYRKTNKSFGEGLCYPCFMNAPENAECILRPELCQAHLGKGRSPEWEEQHHNRPHFVYLALTNTVKVGVTREDQIPTRWIDQGAHSAIILARTPYRQLAGFIEVVLKEHFTDKTNWQKMLKNEWDPTINLAAIKQLAGSYLPEHFKDYLMGDDEVVTISYPVLTYPAKISSTSFEKAPLIHKQLVGIRGQYFMFEEGLVLNIRKNSGYEIELTV